MFDCKSILMFGVAGGHDAFFLFVNKMNLCYFLNFLLCCDVFK